MIQVLSDNRLFITLSNNSKLNNHVISWRDVVSNFERKLNENTFIGNTRLGDAILSTPILNHYNKK